MLGLAIALHSVVTRRMLGWAMLALLAIMTSIPAWIAFGPGERQCVSTVALLTGEIGCRVVFGAGAMVMAGLLVFAVVLARKKRLVGARAAIARLPMARSGPD